MGLSSLGNVFTALALGLTLPRVKIIVPFNVRGRGIKSHALHDVRRRRKVPGIYVDCMSPHSSFRDT